MGILDKIKNLFTDEEEIIETQEIEVEEEVQEDPPKLPTFMREKIEKEEKQVNILEEAAKEEEIVSDRELTSQNVGFKFPIAFDEKDFEVTAYSSQNVVKREREVEKKKSVSELYSAKKEDKKETKHVFRPTPIISPVYGILDKNYKKEEVKAKKENAHDLKRTSKKVDFESVRMKAYGSLSDEINDNLLSDVLTDVSVASNVEVYHEDDLLSDITSTNEISDTIGSAEENYYDFGVTYEVPRILESDLKEVEEEIKIVDYNDEEVVAEKIEVKEEVVENPEENNIELTDDLFNLIDSMYEERDDL